MRPFLKVKSVLSYLNLLLFILIVCFSITLRKPVISYDIFGYYFYLPAIFHVRDIQLKDYNQLEKIHQKVNPESGGVYQIYKAKDTDNHVIRYPIGTLLRTHLHF